MTYRALTCWVTLPDQKDKHSSKLVNRLVDEFKQLKPPVFVLEGNHDYIDQDNPFFRFLSCIEGVHFILKPTEPVPGLFKITHRPTQAEFDASCAQIPKKPMALLVHQTFAGSIAETGGALAGLSTSPIESLRPDVCWAGDVHKPQRVGPVTYVGAPYHVRFGDNFTPRVVLTDWSTKKNLFFDCPRKWSITVQGPEQIEGLADVQAGDQIKLCVELTREELVEWVTVKAKCIAACKSLGLEVFGVDLKTTSAKRERARLEQPESKTSEDVLSAYCKAEKVSSAIKAAGELFLDV